MKVRKTIQREEGIYEVDCDFNQEEMDSIIEIGLNVLLAHGALPFTQDEEEEEDTFIVAAPSTLEH